MKVSLKIVIFSSLLDNTEHESIKTWYKLTSQHTCIHVFFSLLFLIFSMQAVCHEYDQHFSLNYFNMLLKPKRHSPRCHGFVVHTLILRMHTNVVYFRVMRRLYRRKWNWLWNWWCVNKHSWAPWQWPRDHGLWRLTLTAYLHCRMSKLTVWIKLLSIPTC